MRKRVYIAKPLLVMVMLRHPLFYFSMYSGDAGIHLVMFQSDGVTIGLFACPVGFMFQDLFLGDRPTFHLVLLLGLAIAYASISHSNIATPCRNRDFIYEH